jgi:hypothetical protein
MLCEATLPPLWNIRLLFSAIIEYVSCVRWINSLRDTECSSITVFPGQVVRDGWVRFCRPKVAQGTFLK